MVQKLDSKVREIDKEEKLKGGGGGAFLTKMGILIFEMIMAGS